MSEENSTPKSEPAEVEAHGAGPVLGLQELKKKALADFVGMEAGMSCSSCAVMSC